MREFALLFTTALLAASLATHAMADPFLARFAGAWQGTGTMRTSPDAEREPVNCRSIARIDGKDNVVVEGKCATASLSGTVSMTITETAPDAYRAAVRVTGSLLTYYYSGTRRSEQLRFQSLSPVLIDRVPHHARFTVSFRSADRFTLREVVVQTATGATSELLTMTFERR